MTRYEITEKIFSKIDPSKERFSYYEVWDAIDRAYLEYCVRTLSVIKYHSLEIDDRINYNLKSMLDDYLIILNASKNSLPVEVRILDAYQVIFNAEKGDSLLISYAAIDRLTQDDSVPVIPEYKHIAIVYGSIEKLLEYYDIEKSIQPGLRFEYYMYNNHFAGDLTI